MSDLERLALSAALVPIVALLLKMYVAQPLGKMAKKYLPEKWAEMLTKERG